MKIIIEPHTLQQAKERGATEEEIIETIIEGERFDAKDGRLGSAKVFPFNSLWKGQLKEEKRIEVIFVEQNNQFKTVTVYTYYGKWK